MCTSAYSSDHNLGLHHILDCPNHYMICDRMYAHLVLLINSSSCLDQYVDNMDVTSLTGYNQCCLCAILRLTNHTLIITFYCSTDNEVCTN